MASSGGGTAERRHDSDGGRIRHSPCYPSRPPRRCAAAGERFRCCPPLAAPGSAWFQLPCEYGVEHHRREHRRCGLARVTRDSGAMLSQLDMIEDASRLGPFHQCGDMVRHMRTSQNARRFACDGRRRPSCRIPGRPVGFRGRASADDGPGKGVFLGCEKAFHGGLIGVGNC